MFVKPEEKKFVTAELIAETSFTASEAEIKQRIEALRGAGYTQFTIQLVPGQEAGDRRLGAHPQGLRLARDRRTA